MNSNISTVSRIMLGLEPRGRSTYRDTEVTEFLRGVVRRKEPNYALATQALRQGPAKIRVVVRMFRYPSPDTLIRRVEEILGSAPPVEVTSELLELLKASTDKHEKRTANLLSSVKRVRISLEARAPTSRKLRRCLNAVKADVELEEQWLDGYRNAVLAAAESQ
jgi:hypothetical protein